jgi:hypothetical protein
MELISVNIGGLRTQQKGDALIDHLQARRLSRSRRGIMPTFAALTTTVDRIRRSTPA